MFTKLASLSAELNRSYITEKTGGKKPLFLPPVIMITDHPAVPNPCEVIPSLPKGSYVLMRDYELPDRAEKARDIQEICKKHHHLFGIAGDIDLARSLKADGFHLPEYRLSEIPNLKNEFLITVACHSEASLKEAYLLHADAAFLAPIFPTHSHLETLKDPSLTIGENECNRLCKQIKIPIYALGGITEDTILKLKNTAGIAAIRGFLK